ncbi:MAG: NAD-dependent deacylase [Pseudomonadota bacterium]
MALPNSIVILTGAGISAESGLGTFRDKDGIWTKYPLEDLATPEGFARNPDFVQGFYNDRRRQLKTAKAHAGHEALARLQTHCEAAGRDFLLVTQNVDNLHEQAGSTDVVHMHGELARIRCMDCHSVVEWHENIGSDVPCPACGKAGYLRPHVVWFGEMPLEMDRISRTLSACDLFVSIGTSGAVYPAAGFVQEALYAGARTVELNLEPSENAHVFNEARYGPASEVVNAWVDELVGSQA